MLSEALADDLSDMQTVHTEENGIVHHQLESCDYERGVATALYRFRKHSPYRPPELQFTDICFDRAGGRLWASEPEDRLTLVKQDKWVDTYEVLLPGFPRWSVTAGNYVDASGDGENRTAIASFEYVRSTSELLDWKHTGTQLDGDVTLGGYLFDTRASNEDMAAEFTVYVGGLDYWNGRRGRDKRYSNRETPIISFAGKLQFDGASGVADLRSLPETGREGKGTLALTVNDKGEISGSGTFTWYNARLVGLKPHDWETATWEIRKLVGHLVGKNGKQFSALVIAGGQTVDQDGFVNPVHAYMTIHGYSGALPELYGDSADFDGE